MKMNEKTNEVNGWSSVSISEWKLHICPTYLVDALVADGIVRNHILFGSEPITEVFIDLPGMCMIDRSIEKIDINGLSLEMPSEDFEVFYHELRTGVKERTFSDGSKYYKIHGWRACIVFTPEQRQTMLALMNSMLVAVTGRAAKDSKEFSRRIAAINADGARVISHKAPESLKLLDKLVPLSGQPSGAKN